MLLVYKCYEIISKCVSKINMRAEAFLLLGILPNSLIIDTAKSHKAMDMNMILHICPKSVKDTYNPRFGSQVLDSSANWNTVSRVALNNMLYIS